MLYASFISPLIQGALQILCTTYPHSHIHIHIPMAEETMQGTNLLTVSNKGFNLLLKDYSTLTLGGPGMEVGIF